MSAVVWFKSGRVVLTGFKPLKSDREDDGEHHEVVGEEPVNSNRIEIDQGYQSLVQMLTIPDDDDTPDVYTVENAVDEMGFGLFQVLLSIFAGLIWLAKSFEIMMLAILPAALKCEWNLNSAEEATITMVLFFGFLLGCPVWGVMADKFGRKRTLLVVTISGFVAGLASAFSPNYYVMLVFRWLIGFGYSGSFLAAPYCLEFLPARSRAVVVCLLEAAWATGSVLEVLLALVVMTSIEYQPWRWLLGFSALPTLVVIALFILAPESPMYLITRGKHSKAKKVLSLIAKMNCKQLPVGRLVTAEEKEQMRKETSPPLNDIAAVSTVAAMKDINDELKCEMNEDISNGTLPNMDNRTVPNMDNDDLTMISSDNESDSELLLDEHTHGRKQIINKLANYYHWILILFKNGWWRTTLLLWYLWFATNIMYYGGALLTTALFQHDEHCGLNQNNTTDDDCKELTKSDYVRLVWTTCAEFPGIIWIIVLLLVIGRKRSLALTAFAAAVCYGLLFLCLNETILTVFLFGVRGFATGFFQGIYVYTPEVYPTTVRAFGVSLCASVSRLGSMIAPYIAQTLLAYSSIATISLFIVFSLLSSVASLLLPIETRGRPMKDTGG